MPLTAYPGLLANRGAPFLNVAPILSAGEIFFVQRTRGSNNNDGRDSIRPMATWQAAYNKCRANRDDMVVVLPGHTENITTAGGITLGTAGVTTVMKGVGANRPTFTWTTAVGASLNVTAANNVITGIGGPRSGAIFAVTGIDAVTAGINISAASCILYGHRVVLATASAQATLGILTTAAADMLQVEGCEFVGTSDAGTAAAIRIVGGNGHHITDNTFIGAYTAGIGAIENVTTACTNTYVDDNRINNLTAASTKAMVFVATSTGQISRNYMQILSGTAPITGAAMSWVGANYYAATIATAGTLI